MFLPKEETESFALRQGDILKDVPLLGAIEIEKHQPMLDVAWTVCTKSESGFCMVVSHSCEIAVENDVKVTSLILAPIRDALGAAKPDQFDLLKNTNVITPDTKASFLKYFYLETHELLPFGKGCLVDFSKVFSLRKSAVKSLLPKKILQLKPETAQVMAKKLAVYFFRTTPPDQLPGAVSREMR